MIIVTIHLASARTGKLSELGRMFITNDGTGDFHRRNYDVAVCRKGSTRPDGPMTRRGRVDNHPAPRLNIWRLVARALKSAFPEEA